jgi:hypothetical protein
LICFTILSAHPNIKHTTKEHSLYYLSSNNHGTASWLINHFIPSSCIALTPCVSRGRRRRRKSRTHHLPRPQPRRADCSAAATLVCLANECSGCRKWLTIIFSGHKFRQSVHPGAFGPDLAKKLSQLVKMEKNVMRSMELVGRERMEVAVSWRKQTAMFFKTDPCCSNNSLSGARAVTMTFPMLPTSLACSFTRLANSKINSSTATTNTA